MKALIVKGGDGKRTILVWGLSAPIVGIVLCSLIFSLTAVDRPFPGFLVYPNLLISPLYLPGWLPSMEGVAYPWALHSLDTAVLHSAEDLEERIGSITPGEVHIFVFKKGMERTEKGLQVFRFRASDFLAVCGPLFMSSAVLFAVGFLVGISSPWTPPSWNLFLSCLSLGGWMGTYPDWIISHRIPWALLFFSSMAPAVLLRLILFYPFPLPAVRNHPSLGLLPLGFPGLTVFVLFLTCLSSPDGYARVDFLNASLIVLFLSVFGVKLAGIVASSHDERDRRIARISLLGGLVPFALVWIPLGVLVYLFHVPYALFTFSVPLIILPQVSMAWALRKTYV